MEKRKILLIDDEEEFADIMKTRLEHDGGYDVMTLSTAKDAVERVREFVPDLILLDLLIPGIGGIELCEMLDKDPVGAGIPIIVLSGLDKQTDKLKAYKCGVVGYFTKPINTVALMETIEKAITDKRGHGDR